MSTWWDQVHHGFQLVKLHIAKKNSSNRSRRYDLIASLVSHKQHKKLYTPFSVPLPVQKPSLLEQFQGVLQLNSPLFNVKPKSLYSFKYVWFDWFQTWTGWVFMSKSCMNKCVLWSNLIHIEIPAEVKTLRNITNTVRYATGATLLQKKVQHS